MRVSWRRFWQVIITLVIVGIFCIPIKGMILIGWVLLIGSIIALIGAILVLIWIGVKEFIVDKIWPPKY